MTLMPEILVCREFLINTLRLKYDADMPPQGSWFANYIQPRNLGSSCTRYHKRRKNPEKSGFPASVGTKEPEQFCRAHFKRNSVEGSSILIPVDQVTNRNDRFNPVRMK